MFFEQADLFRGMGKDFVKDFMETTVKESHRKGYFLFREGDRARYFYVLLKGSIRISIGETGHTVYRVDHPGEAFGWSSLIGRDAYSASAECMEPTKLLKIENKKLQKILEGDAVNGLIFFKHLAGTLGSRLLESYKMISAALEAEIPTSFGTGQVQESQATTG